MKSILMFTASLCLMGLSAPAFGQSVGYDSVQYGQSIEAVSYTHLTLPTICSV